MCEKRTRKIKRGADLNRLREQRRSHRRRHNLPLTPPDSDDSNQGADPAPPVDPATQNQVIYDLAWKTVALVHKNRLIQQRIIELQQQTSEFVTSIMKNPENRRRYAEYVRVYGLPQRLLLQVRTNKSAPYDVKLKTEKDL
ncbi:uncharacterized protein LOC114351287 [Ostrinia furnacalis]|nr:uncharacterized protein LOC114351287 [Ostrinia furnacalis]